MALVSRWLDVEPDVAEESALLTLPSAVLLLDVNNDNEYKLLVGDFEKDETVGSKIKVFKGTEQFAEIPLPDLPLSIAGMYTTEGPPRLLPLLAVALGTAVYIYKNMKLFYKYYLPCMELNVAEMEVWRELTELRSEDDITAALERLKAIPYDYLSPQSQQLLSADKANRMEFIKQNESNPTRSGCEATCMTTLQMQSANRYAPSCLVIATEDGDVLFLEPQTFSLIHRVKVCDTKLTPYQMVATGLFDVDYRVTIATREKAICIIKREWEVGRCIATLEAHIVSVEVLPGDGNIVVTCTDNTVRCFNRKGKRQWSVSVEHGITCSAVLPLEHLATALLAVALRSGHVLFYNRDTVVDSLFVKDAVSAMKFGQYGREEHVLCIITMAGSLKLKILKRTASFPAESAERPRSPSRAPVAVPRRSKLFLEQAVRERDNAVAMHSTFQREVNWLRLTAARGRLESLRRSENSVGVGRMKGVRLGAQMLGSRPALRCVLSVENSSGRAVSGLALLFYVDPKLFKLSTSYIQIPLLTPGSALTFSTTIEDIFEDGVAPELLLEEASGVSGARSCIRLLLLAGGARPAAAAALGLPPVDPVMLPDK